MFGDALPARVTQLAAAAGLALDALAHVVPPADTPGAVDGKHFLDVRVDPDGSVALFAWSTRMTRENDVHVTVCFVYPDGATEFPATSDASNDEGAIGSGSVKPKSPDWTSCQVLAVFTKNGEPIYYRLKEITR